MSKLKYIEFAMTTVIGCMRNLKTLALCARDDYPNNFGVQVAMVTRIKITNLIMDICKKITNLDLSFSNYLPRLNKQMKLHLNQLKKLNCDIKNDQELFRSTYKLFLDIRYNKLNKLHFSSGSMDICCR